MTASRLPRYSIWPSFCTIGMSCPGTTMVPGRRRQMSQMALIEAELTAADPTYDVGSPLIDAKTRKLVAVGFQRDRTEWDVIDPSYDADFAALRKLHDGDIGFLSSTENGRRLIVAYFVDNGPTSFYSYDRATKQGTFLFVSRPALLKYQLAAMKKPVAYKAADG